MHAGDGPPPSHLPALSIDPLLCSRAMKWVGLGAEAEQDGVEGSRRLSRLSPVAAPRPVLGLRP